MARPATATPAEPAAEAPATLAAVEEALPRPQKWSRNWSPRRNPKKPLMAEAPEAPQVEAVETVAAVTSPAPDAALEAVPEAVAEAEPAKPARNAPIFDSAEPEAIELTSAETPEEELARIANHSRAASTTG